MKSELIKIITAQVCLHATMAGMRMATPLLALRDGYSAGSIGILLALFAIMQVFLAIPSGRFADKYGLKRPIWIAVAMSSVGALLAFIWPIFSVLCVSALLTGGATGAASIALQRHVGRSAQNVTELRQVFSWLSIGPAFSNFLGPLGAGLCIDYSGFQSAFIFMTLLPLLSLWFISSIKNLPPQEVSAETQNLRVWDLLKNKNLRQLLIVNWFLSSCWDVHTFMVPVIGHEYGISASATGAVLGSFAITAALIRFLLPWFASRTTERIVITISMLGTGFFLAIYPWMYNAWQMGMCSAVLGIFLGAVQPMVMSALHQMTPEERHGEALGLRLMAINASSVAMPMLFGVLGVWMGVGSVFWLVAAYVTIGSHFAWTLRPHKNHE